MRVLVCCGPGYQNERLIDEVLLDAKHLYGMSVLVHESGGESFARWAKKNGVASVIYTEAACSHELMLAFPGADEEMKRRTRAAGRDVLEVWDEPGQGG